MKGVVNKGIQELVESRFGSDAWEAICFDAGCDEPSFSPAFDYPDEMTANLVMATSRYSGMSPEEVMIEFGKFWIPNTGKQSHPTLFALAGNSPREFLFRMDRVHTQATLSIQGAQPPKLTVENLPDGGLVMRYASTRALCPVLHGLILGVGELFDQQLEVTERSCTRRGDEECVFEVRFP